MSAIYLVTCTLLGKCSRGRIQCNKNQISFKSHPCDSNLTKESITILSNPINSSSLEENTGFDNRSSLKQHASQDEPLFSSSSMPYTLSFEDSTAVPYVLNKTCQCYHGENSKETQEEPKNNRKSKRGRSSSEIQDHIMSERKRRENIAKLFIALSAVIPVLKKVSLCVFLFSY